MKERIGLVKGSFVVFLILLWGCGEHNQFGKGSRIVSGEYFGQRPPGDSAELFAPGIISTGMYELNSVFFPNGKEVIWSVQVSPMKWMLIMAQEEDGIWSLPAAAPFNGTYGGVDPAVTTDGNRIYFCSDRPADPSDTTTDFDIWYVDRTEHGWSEPVNLGPPVNSVANEFYPSLTRQGNLFFQSWREGGDGPTDIYKAIWNGGIFTEVERLPYPVNGPGFEGDAMIAPDEQYIIVSTRRDGENYGQSDLYICYRQNDGSWTEPKNLGPRINSAAAENCQILSPCGKYLFFTSRRYRASPKGELTYQQLMDMECNPENGKGDVYWIRWDERTSGPAD